MKIVVSIGGNALGKTPEEQIKALEKAVQPIAGLVEAGHEIAVVHGNGPQVGAVNLAMEYAHNAGQAVPSMPFPECVAMTQGYIGYHIQNVLSEELCRRGVNRQPVTVVTQVVVDEKDAAFQNPTKPVGSFYTLEEKTRLEKERGYVMREDAGRGYRRMVPSPKPLDIVERDIILRLIQQGHPVIACGGGGIPVIREGRKLSGVAAVVDKDYASTVMAKALDADMIFFLTGVDQVAINWNTSQQTWLSRVTVAEMEQYVSEKQFAPGSMLPKVEAAMDFVRGCPRRRAFITSLSDLGAVIQGQQGTEIVGFEI